VLSLLCSRLNGTDKVADTAPLEAILVFYNLPLANQHSLLIPEADLIVQTVRLVDDRLDDGIDDFAAVHGRRGFYRRLCRIWRACAENTTTH
jgi:hypothetical protein